MIKSNELHAEGYKKIGNEIISICSCPFFKTKYNNKGSIIVINEDLNYEII